MAQELTQATNLLTQAQVLARRMRALYRDITDFQTNNTKQGINWVAPPTYLTGTALDAAGNVNGYPFGTAQMSNIINTYQQFLNLMNNAAVAQGDHAANVYSVAPDASV
jgi:hypothetical protein